MYRPSLALRSLGPLLAGSLALGFVTLAGCETEFDPFEKTGAAFSMFGYFDADADTQYVRVAALRRTAFDEAPLDAVVTLTHLGTGAVTTLRDSLFRFPNGALAHNFWTTARVAEGVAYRLTATGPDGARATATFRTPASFPNPQLESGLAFNSSPSNPPQAQSMSFEGIEKFADVRITYVLDDPDVTVTVSYLARARLVPFVPANGSASDTWYLAFNAYADVQRALGGTSGATTSICPGLHRAYVFVAAATPSWPDLLGLDPEVLALPSTVSNVEGGLGYVGGVVTRSYEWSTLTSVFGLHRAGCR